PLRYHLVCNKTYLDPAMRKTPCRNIMELERLIKIAHQAEKEGLQALSVEESLSAALVLNRCDWLEQLGFTIAEALDRIGLENAAIIPVAAKKIGNRGNAHPHPCRLELPDSEVEAMLSVNDDITRFDTVLKRKASVPGYRYVSL